jgi:dephospho-CoA kinase
MTEVSAARPFLIALTGGIASGKTAVAQLFAKLGVPVLDTDQIARDVVEPGSPVLARIARDFGQDILDTAGRLDRGRMRERIFSDPSERKKLESILHPAIREELWRRSAEAQGAYQIHVIPLLVESSQRGVYNRILLVDCPEEEQIRRLTQRDQSSLEMAQNILAAQASREQRLSVADDVIVNTGTLEDLPGFVATLHNNYLLLAQEQAA